MIWLSATEARRAQDVAARWAERCARAEARISAVLDLCEHAEAFTGALVPADLIRAALTGDAAAAYAIGWDAGCTTEANDWRSHG